MLCPSTFFDPKYAVSGDPRVFSDKRNSFEKNIERNPWWKEMSKTFIPESLLFDPPNREKNKDHVDIIMSPNDLFMRYLNDFS